MSIASELSALQTDITNARTAITTKGGTVTSGGGSSQLATDIATIPTGITPTGNINITTTNQTDVTNYATAQVVDSNLTAGNIKDGVSILGVTGTYTGGGGTGIPREISAQGVYQTPSTSFTFSLPSNATNIGDYALDSAFYTCSSLTAVDLSKVTTISGQYALDRAFANCRNLTSIDLSNLITISGQYAMSNAFNGTNLTTVDLSKVTTISGQYAMSNAFNVCTSLTSVDLSNLTTVSGSHALDRAFYMDSLITNVDLSNLTIIGENSSSGNNGHFANAFYYCRSLTSISFPKLEKIYCTGSSSSQGTFYSCRDFQKMYFPKLDTITYGSGASSSNQNACKYIFSSCASLTELHFGAANQAAIEATAGYSTAWGRGAGNVTIYFDL